MLSTEGRICLTAERGRALRFSFHTHQSMETAQKDWGGWLPKLRGPRELLESYKLN